MATNVTVKVFNVFRRLFKLPFLESILASLTLEKSPDHFFCKLVPNPYQYKKPSFRNVSKSNIKLKVDISDYIGHFYFFGFSDRSHSNLFEICRTDFYVLDVGANIGYTILKLAQLTPNGRVIGFEPDLYNYNACVYNLNANQYSNVEVLNLGLGSKDAVLDLEVRTPSNRGGNRIMSSPYHDAIKVQVKRLDDIFTSLNMNRLDLVKIDVEGYELKVLEGAESVLRKFKPVLFIELDDDNLKDQGDSAYDLVSFLHSLGYKSIRNVETSNQIDTATDFSHCHFDIIAK